MKKQTVVAEELKKRIQNGFYAADVRLPSETELAEELNVNKITPESVKEIEKKAR